MASQPISALLSPGEAAALLNLSERTLRDLKRRGLIRYVAISDRRIAYRPEDCDEYITSRVRTDEPCQTRPTPKRTAARNGKIIPFSRR